MIEIWATSSCNYCKAAKKVAEDYALRYEYILVDDDQELQKRFKTLFPNAKTVPQITWGGDYIGGYTEFLNEIENTRNYGDGQL